jgi:hypothetical protein
MSARAGAWILLLMIGCLSGCAVPGSTAPTTFVIAPGHYSAAFDAAIESLIDLGFELERVDARHGIITTAAKSSAGLASPWHRHQSTFGQEVEDLLNRQVRRAIVTFEISGEPQHAPPAPQTVPGPSPLDLREADGPMVATVEVVLERLRFPGMRLEPSVMRLSSRAQDPQLRRAGMWPQYAVAFSQDPLLAQRIGARISAAAGNAPAATAAP